LQRLSPHGLHWLTVDYKEKNINKRVPLFPTYHPSLEKISGIVRHHWKEIEIK
jgi:uracil-DNA glycosylase